MRLVIADENPVGRRSIATTLEALGHQVTTAADGDELLTAIRQLEPDAVVAEVILPVLDGFEICRAARKDPAIATIPILLLTSSYVEPSDRTLALRSGARDLLRRSPDLSEVIAALDALQTTK